MGNDSAQPSQHLLRLRISKLDKILLHASGVATLNVPSSFRNRWGTETKKSRLHWKCRAIHPVQERRRPCGIIFDLDHAVPGLELLRLVTAEHRPVFSARNEVFNPVWKSASTI